MIGLFLRPDPEHELDADEAPELAPAAAIEHTYFVVPMRLNIDGEELLAFPGVYPDWRPLPALGFVSQMFKTLSRLKDGESGTVTLEDGGLLLIACHSDTLILKSSLSLRSVTVPRADLLSAAEMFARVVCDYVLSVSPAMTTHPAWSDWCPEPS